MPNRSHLEQIRLTNNRNQMAALQQAAMEQAIAAEDMYRRQQIMFQEQEPQRQYYWRPGTSPFDYNTNYKELTAEEKKAAAIQTVMNTIKDLPNLAVDKIATLVLAESNKRHMEEIQFVLGQTEKEKKDV